MSYPWSVCLYVICMSDGFIARSTSFVLLKLPLGHGLKQGRQPTKMVGSIYPMAKPSNDPYTTCLGLNSGLPPQRPTPPSQPPPLAGTPVPDWQSWSLGRSTHRAMLLPGATDGPGSNPSAEILGEPSFGMKMSVKTLHPVWAPGPPPSRFDGTGVGARGVLTTEPEEMGQEP